MPQESPRGVEWQGVGLDVVLAIMWGLTQRRAKGKSAAGNQRQRRVPGELNGKVLVLMQFWEYSNQLKTSYPIN
jgi:hypothetical protein